MSSRVTPAPFVQIEFFGPEHPNGHIWDLTREPDALRVWYHVPQIGDRVDIEGTDPESPRVLGKVFEVTWSDDRVMVLLTPW